MGDGEHQHRPGLDITLSAPKSVSLEGLVFGARRVVRAHDEAVRETLDWIEADLLQTRGYDPATGIATARARARNGRGGGRLMGIATSVLRAHLVADLAEDIALYLHTEEPTDTGLVGRVP